MHTPGQATLLRIYTDENAVFGAHSLIDVIIRRARDAHLAGATVLRGRKGFGKAAHVHGHRDLGFDDNFPVVVEIIDEESRLRPFVSGLADLNDIGLVTFEKVEVLRYGDGGVAP